MLKSRTIRFAPASKSELIVFGSARPDYRNEQVREWIEFMKNQNIQRICCLLTASQLTGYTALLDAYRQVFGPERVCWTPIEDFRIVDSDTLIHRVLPFLSIANEKQEKVVVHCSAGIGRTGQVLAAWLVAKRGFGVEDAIATVKASRRNPYEAVMAAPFRGQSPWEVASELHQLLNKCGQLPDQFDR
ncbi:MAG: dual specificity protein phosphatase family protein [Cyanobacteria bacterium P01_D01_bin.1]